MRSKGPAAVFIAVGTPADEDGSADLQYVLEVAEEISNSMLDYKVIINKSTVPVGTSKRIENSLKKNNSIKSFDVVSNPEFLREGAAINDFMRPDKIIIGCRTKKAEKF